MSQRVLITGGSGFIAGRLAQHLSQAGYQVVLGSRNLVKTHLWLPKAEVIQLNWENAATLKNSCMEVDVIVHAAGMNAQDCASNPIEALAFNGVATSRIVEAACYSGVKCFIYLSTAHVYSSSLVGTITEECCPRNLHPYATSHLAGENAVLSASQHGHTEGIVLRLSNIFGAPSHNEVNCWELLVNDLCRQAVQKGTLKLHTNGLQQRDFIAMMDVCSIIEKLIFDISNKKIKNGIFNVGTGVAHSVLEMSKIIQKRCEKILGFSPELKRNIDDHNYSIIPLNYQTTRSDEIGKSNNLNISKEIDSLLEYCKSEFSQKR